MPDPAQEVNRSINRATLIAAGVVSPLGASVYVDGPVTPAKTATGVYTLTLPSPGLASSSCQVIATLNGNGGGAGNGLITVDHTSDTVKTISTADTTGAAADRGFTFQVWQR